MVWCAPLAVWLRRPDRAARLEVARWTPIRAASAPRRSKRGCKGTHHRPVLTSTAQRRGPTRAPGPQLSLRGRSNAHGPIEIARGRARCRATR